MKHIPLIAGNWKMNPTTRKSAKRLFLDVKKGITRVRDVETVVMPPTVYLADLYAALNGNGNIQLGVQSLHPEKAGAHTGEISLPMVADFSVSHVIIGHSEERASGVDDARVHATLAAVIKGGLTGIVCIGEKTRDTNGSYFTHIEKQLRTALAGISKAKCKQIVIAYEPIWAIGTGATATPADVHEMKLFIQKILVDLYGRSYAYKIRILYGGSVHTGNAELLLTDGEVDGFLIGGASLVAKEFIEIIKMAQHHGE